MSALLFYPLLLCGVLLFWVGSVVAMRYAERRFPAFSRWLDRHVGEEPEWLR